MRGTWGMGRGVRTGGLGTRGLLGWAIGSSTSWQQPVSPAVLPHSRSASAEEAGKGEPGLPGKRCPAGLLGDVEGGPSHRPRRPLGGSCLGPGGCLGAVSPLRGAPGLRCWAFRVHPAPPASFRGLRGSWRHPPHPRPLCPQQPAAPRPAPPPAWLPRPPLSTRGVPQRRPS